MDDSLYDGDAEEGAAPLHLPDGPRRECSNRSGKRLTYNTTGIPPTRISRANSQQLWARLELNSRAKDVVHLKHEATSSPPQTREHSDYFDLQNAEMAGLFGQAQSNSATATQGSITGDIALNNPPEDSIQDLSFSPVSLHLSVASWDNKVRIYEVDPNGGSGKALIDLGAPALSTCWSKDGTKVFAAGANKQAMMLDLGAGSTTPQTVAAHDAPIKCVESIMVNGSPMLVTGSWDKTIKYWDLRQQTPAATVQCKDRVYAMDTRDQLLVVATADRWVEIFNLAQPNAAYKQIQSPLKWQTRTISCFADATGFAIGSIEGRCAIQYVEEKDSSSNFSFKCHRQTAPNTRDQSNVYSVNSISFHPIHGTFSTAGSDGTFHFWDKDAKHRLKGYPEVGGSISCTDFSHDGSVFAYAVSYDWHQGYQSNNPQYPNKVMLHSIAPDECKPRPNAKKR
ncbi:WD40 repeat-like protein [Aureobasidium subglaciale]|nr:WD40 repeat-like protein [Aureobasidium subglaciale]